MVRGGGKLMGVVCGHPNHCITQTNFRWKFGRFITTVRPGACGSSNSRVSRLCVPVAATRATWTKGYFC